MNQSNWMPIEPDQNTARAKFERPLEELAAGRIPALVIRQAWPAENCSELIQRLIDEGLLYDPDLPIPPKFQKQSIPEGYYREGSSAVPSLAWDEQKVTGKSRIDIGSSLGYRGSDQDAFFAHSAETNELFERLFADLAINQMRPVISAECSRAESLGQALRVARAPRPAQDALQG